MPGSGGSFLLLGSSIGGDFSSVGGATIGIADNPSVPGSQKMTVPIGTTGGRPASPTNGDLRYNTTTSKLETYEAGAWADLVGAGGAGEQRSWFGI